MSSTVMARCSGWGEVASLFVVRPGPRPGVEVVARGRAVRGSLDVNERGGPGGQRVLQSVLELRRRAYGESLRSERAGELRPIVIGNAGQLRRQRAVLPSAQPDIAERAVVEDQVDDRQFVARGGLHLDAVHLHAAVAGD